MLYPVPVSWSVYREMFTCTVTVYMCRVWCTMYLCLCYKCLNFILYHVPCTCACAQVLELDPVPVPVPVLVLQVLELDPVPVLVLQVLELDPV